MFVRRLIGVMASMQAAFCAWIEYTMEQKASERADAYCEQSSLPETLVVNTPASVSNSFVDIPLVVNSAVRCGGSYKFAGGPVEHSPTPLPCPYSPVNFGERTPLLLDNFKCVNLDTTEVVSRLNWSTGVLQEEVRPADANAVYSHTIGEDIENDAISLQEGRLSQKLSASPVTNTSTLIVSNGAPPALPPRKISSISDYRSSSNTPDNLSPNMQMHIASTRSYNSSNALDHLRDIISFQNKERQR